MKNAVFRQFGSAAAGLSDTIALSSGVALRVPFISYSGNANQCFAADLIIQLTDDQPDDLFACGNICLKITNALHSPKDCLYYTFASGFHGACVTLLLDSILHLQHVRGNDILSDWLDRQMFLFVSKLVLPGTVPPRLFSP